MKVQSFLSLSTFYVVVSNTAQGLQPSHINKQHPHPQPHPTLQSPSIRTKDDAATAHGTNRNVQSNSLPSSLFAAAYFFAACTFSWWQPCPVLAETTTTPVADDAWTKNIASSLQAPNGDTPQIPLPVITRANGVATSQSSTSGMLRSKSPKPSVSPAQPWRIQGLVSLKNPQIERPFGNDFMVIQVLKERPPTEPYVITEQTKQNVLGGAKIQVGKTRFPSSISLGIENAKVQETWKELSSKQDLWLETTICKEESIKFPCAPEEQRYRGVALSKLFDALPIGGGEDSQQDTAPVAVRLPAALVLERINDEEEGL